MVLINTTTTSMEIKRDYKKFPFIHNAKVLWINGTYIERVPHMYDKGYALCRTWVREHRTDKCFIPGKLVVVSMLDNEYLQY